MRSKIKVAIVDDQTMFAKALAMLINQLNGYQVIFTASNGKDFINKIKPDIKPRIVLLDILMPEMNGYETCKWIKDNYPSIYVIALSSMNAESTIIRMIKCGAHGYLLKDADPSVFIRAFEDVEELGFYYNENYNQKTIIYSNRLDKDSIECIYQFKEREQEFLEYCATDLTYEEIADKMNLSPRTMDGYRNIFFDLFKVNSRVGIVLYAIRNGFITV